MNSPRLDHIAIAVANLEEAMRFYIDSLGLTLHSIEQVDDEGVRIAKLTIGDTHIELLEPLSADTPVGKFLQERGGGLHHICLGVDNISNRLATLKSRGVRLINQSPKPGAGNAAIAFIHPKSAGGVLIELSQPASNKPD